ncbi:Retrovirus-related Pol polyprotein from transposon 17.6, partial [Mucuna pruriens]
MNLTILDVVKKEVTKLLTLGIIYPISDSQWVSPVQVVPKKFKMTVMKNQMTSWYQCEFRTTGKLQKIKPGNSHGSLSFAFHRSRKSHYYFLDGFSSYMQIHIAPEDQHKTTFTCPFGTFAYTRMPSIFSDLLQDCMEVFMDDFTVYADSFDACLDNLSKVLTRCIDINLVLNFEKCHFMVIEGIVLGHLYPTKALRSTSQRLTSSPLFQTPL